MPPDLNLIVAPSPDNKSSSAGLSWEKLLQIP